MNHRTDCALGDNAPEQQNHTRGWLRAGWAAVWVTMIACLMSQPLAFAAEGDLSAFTANPIPDPIVQSDAVFFARKVTAWENDGASWLLLEGEAGFSIGVYGFSADNAVVRIVTELRPGRTVRHLSIYLENARHLSGHGLVSAEASRLLVTATTTGTIQTKNDLFVKWDEVPQHALIGDAEARMQRHRDAMARVTISPPDEPLFDPSLFGSRFAGAERSKPAPAPRTRPWPVEAPDATVTTGPAVVTEPSNLPQPVPTGPEQAKQADPGQDDTAAVVKSPDKDPTQTAIVSTDPDTPAAPDTGVLPSKGWVSLNADYVTFDQGDEESTVMLVGNVHLLYEDMHNNRAVSLQSQRVVVFLDGSESDGPVVPAKLPAGRVRGIYLEDNVIVNDSGFTVRAPRVYYDVRENKAVLLEAVLYSYDATMQLPLYMRAETVRQTSANSFEAEDVLLTTSEFSEPHFAIGAARLTLNQEQVQGGGVSNKISATNTTLRVKDTPFFVWPYMSGRVTDIPIKRVRVGYDSNNGMEVQTTWDVFALAGREAPEGVELLGNIDYLGDHGPAVGAELEYGLDNMFGKAEGYLLLDDTGTDEIGGRRDIDQDGGTRGYYKWQHRQYLLNGSELSLESAYVSDETFLEEFFRDEAYASKQYETSLYWKMQEGDQALTFLTRYDLTDFTPQLTTLQAPGYTVDKAPELAYYRTGTSFWDDKLTWFSENRAGYVRARPGEDTPYDRGFSNAQSMELFGISNTTSFEDKFFGMGIPDEWVFRADSRQEVSAPMQFGDYKFVPYVVGRITAYDEDFEAYAGEDEQVRLWGAMGARVSTQLSKTYDAQSGALGVNGLRHIVEPSADIFYAGANIDSDDLPVYDYNVESLQEGGNIRLGLTNTLQTHRGSGNKSRSVDWIVLRTDLVMSSGDTDTDAEIPRYFGQRPEYSIGGDHMYSELLWMVTDTLGMSGELTHSFESDRVVQWRIGGTLQHSPRLRSFVRYDEIEPLDSKLLTYGFTYILTIKYEMGFQQRIDFSRDDSETVDLWLERRVPNWRVRVMASYDDINDEKVIGFVLIPEGFGGGPSPMIR